MKRNESGTLLVIVPNIGDPIIRGIEVTTVGHGYLVLMGDCVHQHHQEKNFIDFNFIAGVVKTPSIK